MHIALIEDEQNEYEVFVRFAKRIEQETSTEIEISYFPDALKFISSYEFQYDAVFMDIELPSINGMKASHELRKLDEKVPLIFVTNLSQFAIEGYSVNALDYILKPLNYHSLLGIILKLKKILSNNSDSYLIIKEKDEVIKLKTDEILYLEVSNHFVSVVLKEKRYRFWGTLKSYQERLPKTFVLCNQCYLVNLKHVKGIKDGYALLENEKLLVSRNRKKAFLNALSEYLGENF